MTEVLTVGALGATLLRRWKLIGVLAVVGAVLGAGYGVLSPKTYTAKAVLIVMAGAADQTGFYQAAQFAEKRAATYPTLVTAPEVLDRTRSDLDLTMSSPALVAMISASNPTDSPLVEVSVTADRPSQAREIADSVADNLSAYAIALEKSGSRITSVTIQKAVPAREPTSPTSPSPAVLGALGLLAGGAVAVLIALALRALPGGSLRRSRRPVDVAPAAATPDLHVSAERLGALTDHPSAGTAADVPDDEDDGEDTEHRRRALAEAHAASALLSLADDLEDDDEDDEEDDGTGRPRVRGNRKKRSASRPATTIGRKTSPSTRDEPRSLSAGR